MSSIRVSPKHQQGAGAMIWPRAPKNQQLVDQAFVQFESFRHDLSCRLANLLSVGRLDTGQAPNLRSNAGIMKLLNGTYYYLDRFGLAGVDSGFLLALNFCLLPGGSNFRLQLEDALRENLNDGDYNMKLKFNLKNAF